MSSTPLVSVVVPVLNGARTLAPVIESVLHQDHTDLELVISDNASTDGTQEMCREYARADDRVVYRRHPENVGLLNNFRSAAESARGSFVRWLGDDDFLEPAYVSRTIEAFGNDRHRVLVTTQIAYVDLAGTVTLDSDYDPAVLASPDPVARLSEMLRLLTSGYALLDPLYGMMRREVAVLPRRNMMREDEVFAARLALEGPWGHVAAPLARRHRAEVPSAGLVRLLGVPGWHRHVRDLLQCRELMHWIERSRLDPSQRRSAHAQVLRMYARRKATVARRRVTQVERMVGLPVTS